MDDENMTPYQCKLY